MVKTILLRGGTTAQHANFKGYNREITVDTTKKTLVVHDGSTAGGIPLAKKSEIPTKLSQLTENAGLWKKTSLTKVSQLTDDVGYWTGLSKVSQLANNLNWKTAHCSYCSYCMYCSQCSRCSNVHCYQVQCNQVHCGQVQCAGDCNRCERCGSYCIDTGYYNCMSNCSSADCCYDSS